MSVAVLCVKWDAFVAVLAIVFNCGARCLVLSGEMFAEAFAICSARGDERASRMRTSICLAIGVRVDADDDFITRYGRVRVNMSPV